MDKVWNGLALKTFNGTGRLACPKDNDYPCEFVLSQLINGRLAVQLHLHERFHSSTQSHVWLEHCRPMRLTGALTNGASVTAIEIDVVSSRFPIESDGLILDGFIMRPGFLEIVDKTNRATAFHKRICEVTNLRLYRHSGPVAAHVQSRRISIERIAGIPKTLLLTSGLKAAGIFGTISIEMVDQDANNELDEDQFLEILCGLLSIVERSHVWPVAQHFLTFDGSLLRSLYRESVFHQDGLGHPLIPADALPGFLETAFQNYLQQYTLWDLGIVLDYYVQAMSLRSAWPQAIAFFTALETLKAAFLAQLGNPVTEWYVPRGQFKKKHIVSKIADLLRGHLNIR